MSVDFFLQSVEKMLAWLAIEPTTLDLTCQSGAFFHSPMANVELFSIRFCKHYMSITQAMM